MYKKVDFSKYSSIKIGPIVDVFILDEDSIIECFLIGGANNLLVSDNPPPLGMLSKKYDYITKKGNRLYIGAATKSGRVHSFCKKNNIKNFEYLSKLPGTIGGLIKMNAGMKNDEIFNSLIKIKTKDGYIEKKDINYGYRFTDIDDVVFEAVFEVEEGYDVKKLELFTKMRENQPSLPSAGSAFKNPKNDYAGRLIEAVGLKGKRVGEASFSNIHSNFLVNHKKATFDDAIFLINEAKKRVFEEFGINLECEIQIV